MEKRKPTHDLAAIQSAIGSLETLAITKTAYQDAIALGFTRNEIVETIKSITSAMFFKSMTTYADNKVWQDVYHVPAEALTLYVKFQDDAVTEFRLISFKEK